MNNISLPYDVQGKPKHFDPDHYLDSVEQMICADEIETALYMLDHLPGFYRDNVPQRAVDLKKTLYRQLLTTEEYVFDTAEIKEVNESIHNRPLSEQYLNQHFHPRGPIAISLVKRINDMGFMARIVEVGPANYWLPAALNGLELNFKYDAYSISAVAQHIKVSKDSDRPTKTIFCCFETIEHLWNPEDIYHYYCKSEIDADYILLGCPKYTLYGGLPNWEDRELGHLRTYTPKDLQMFAEKYWNMNWNRYDAEMMVLVGEKK